MKTDRELLELAAKAAGIELGPVGAEVGSASFDGEGLCKYHAGGFTSWRWRPLTDDGDALRLAVKLRLNVNFEEFDGAEYACAVPHKSHQGHDEVMGDDENAATRRAIVRAAAALAA